MLKIILYFLEFLPTAEDGVESPNRLYIHVLDSPISRVDLKKRNGKFAFAHLNYIKLQWPLENMRKLVKGDGQNQLRRSVLWKMFERESSKDVTIVAGNGVELKCHGAILEGKENLRREFYFNIKQCWRVILVSF